MNKKELEVFDECNRHYELAKEDNDIRRDGFDTADELFRSYIDEDDWPYSSLIFIPKVFTAIFEKTSRLIGTKPRGRLIPREGADVVKAKINNELLSYQWDAAAAVDGEPLIAKWAQMDMNARKYGAAFALVKWQYIRKIKKGTTGKGDDKKPKYESVPHFDGPFFQVLNNRDVLCNPSYSTIKNWFQYREYVTLQELYATNDVARGEPIYKNLDELMDKVRKEMKTIDRRDNNYEVRNKTLKGYQDYLGSDETNKTIEIVTEYRENRWITFAPKHGVVIRDIENPYNHQQIPVVMLKYYPIDDDIYGLSEIEPIEKLQKALNAITSQYVDAVNMELYPVFGVDSTRVRLHTMEFTPRAKWIITGDPRTAVSKIDTSAPNAIRSYMTTFQMLTGEMAEALGETSAQTSNLNTFAKGQKTATEIKDLAQQRLSRDNFNQIFLGEAIKRLMMLWHSMNQQFYFEPGETTKVLRLVGKDVITDMQNSNLDASALTEESIDTLTQGITAGANPNPMDYETPMFPVQTEEGVVPKLNVQPDQQFAELILEPDDLMGEYDYIADVESMAPPSQEQVIMAKRAALEMVVNPQTQQMLMQGGTQVKLQELMEDYFESLGFKDASKYFEKLPVNPMMNGQPNEAGAVGPEGLPQGQGVNPVAGMAPPQAMAGGPNPQQLAGPQGMPQRPRAGI